MTKTRLIGDIHGDLYPYQLMLEGQKRSIQVGDFGIGFAGPYWHEKAEYIQEQGDHRFIRGNHDHPKKCKEEMTYYIPDGFVENDVMFVGGAWSIDWGWRTEGIDWWADEECSIAEFEQIIDTYRTVKPRVMITHDAPTFVTAEMFVKTGKAFGDKIIQTRTGQAFELMMDIHQPEEWYFGHWHHTASATFRGTKFQCIGVNDFIDVDL